MPFNPALDITIRRTYLFSSTIIGFARIVIDGHILLKELPIFGNAENMMVQVSKQQVAACPQDMDIDMLNRLVYSFRTIIERAVIDEMVGTSSHFGA